MANPIDFYPQKSRARTYAQNAVAAVRETRAYSSFGALACRWVVALDSNHQHQVNAGAADAALTGYSSVHTVAFCVDAFWQQCANSLKLLAKPKRDTKSETQKNIFVALGKGLESAVPVGKNLATILLFANKNNFISLVGRGRNFAPYLTRFLQIAKLRSASESLIEKSTGLVARKKAISGEIVADIAVDFKTVLFTGLEFLCYTSVFSSGTVLVLNTMSTGYGLWKTIAKYRPRIPAQAECGTLGVK